MSLLRLATWGRRAWGALTASLATWGRFGGTVTPPAPEWVGPPVLIRAALAVWRALAQPERLETAAQPASWSLWALPAGWTVEAPDSEWITAAQAATWETE